MSFLVDTSVVIDVLRGLPQAVATLKKARLADEVHASEITRLEVLAGMRPGEEQKTRRLLSVFTWHVLDEHSAEVAGEMGRRWLPAHSGIDAADLAIAATAAILDARLLTKNVKHFPMFEGLSAPY